MKEVKISARTVEEATELALEKLNVSHDQVEVDVLNEGKSGLLGIGAEEATVMVRMKDTEPNEGVPLDEATEVAISILDELLTKMEIEANVELEPGESVMPGEDCGDAVVFDIRGDDLGALIGRRGQTLACLQYLLRMMVSNRVNSFSPLIVDVNGYRQRRFKALESLASRTAEQVVNNKMPSAMEPMPAFERRIIHLTLSDHTQVSTQSIGFGEGRKVVVILKEE
jgi:spoIIIJ-associated protein